MARVSTTRQPRFELGGVSGSLDKAWFLLQLNDRPRHGKEHIRPGRRGAILGWPPRVEWDEQNFRLQVAGTAAPSGRRMSMAGQLRFYVNEWLETGRRADGVEDPRARNLLKAYWACWAVQRLSAQFEPATDGLVLRFPEVPQVGLAGSLDPLGDANRFFALFQLSPWRYTIAECRTCRTYFELNHWNRAYKSGTLCKDCARSKRSESAARSTKQARESAERELYRVAAERFAKRVTEPGWSRNAELRSAIVAHLNLQIAGSDLLKAVYQVGTRFGISAKWLAWAKNRRGIERAVKEKANVKRKRA